MWQGTLAHKEKTDTGTIIVRSETLNESNLVADFSLNFDNVNNTKSSCLGMCSTPFDYTVEI